MESKEKNAYILGTDREELWRLGFQHQVWSSEAREAWKLAGFSYGQTLLDLGCGPGFCTQELGYMVGQTGKVIAVDKSESYIKYLEGLVEYHDLNIETQACDFNDMKLEPNSLDGAYCRWAIAWIPNPEEIITEVIHALKPGGKFIIQEYYDWSTLQTHPNHPNLDQGIFQALTSIENGIGEINIGRRVANIFVENGLDIFNTRPLNKMGNPNNLTWHWPKTFLTIYLPKIAELGLIKKETVAKALDEFDLLEKSASSTIFTPSMIEVIGEKTGNGKTEDE